METESLETTKNAERFQDEKPKKDRKLGDEWSDWSGDINEIEPAITESKVKFLSFSLLAVLLLTGGLGFFWYLVEPRISQLPPMLQTVTHGVMLILSILPVALYGLLLLQVVFGVRVLSYRTIQSFLFFLLPKAVWIGKEIRTVQGQGRTLLRQSQQHGHGGSGTSRLDPETSGAASEMPACVRSQRGQIHLRRFPLSLGHSGRRGGGEKGDKEAPTGFHHRHGLRTRFDHRAQRRIALRTRHRYSKPAPRRAL